MEFLIEPQYNVLEVIRMMCISGFMFYMAGHTISKYGIKKHTVRKSLQNQVIDPKN